MAALLVAQKLLMIQFKPSKRNGFEPEFLILEHLFFYFLMAHTHCLFHILLHLHQEYSYSNFPINFIWLFDGRTFVIKASKQRIMCFIPFIYSFCFQEFPKMLPGIKWSINGHFSSPSFSLTQSKSKSQKQGVCMVSSIKVKMFIWSFHIYNTHNCTTFFSIVLTSNKPSYPKRCITL